MLKLKADLSKSKDSVNIEEMREGDCAIVTTGNSVCPTNTIVYMETKYPKINTDTVSWIRPNKYCVLLHNVPFRELRKAGEVYVRILESGDKNLQYDEENHCYVYRPNLISPADMKDGEIAVIHSWGILRYEGRIVQAHEDGLIVLGGNYGDSFRDRRLFKSKGYTDYLVRLLDKSEELVVE